MWRIISEWVYPAVVVVFFFGLTIFIHEFGHFLWAKRRGLKVERFSIGFGPKIFGWIGKDGVDYRVSWIPCGGYVSLPQMAPMEALEGKTETKAAELPPASPASKIVVALAGPLMNVALAAVLASILWVCGMPSSTTMVGWVERGSPEEQSGIQPGDRIVQVGEQKVKTWGEVMEAVAFSRQPTVSVTVERAGQRLAFDLETKLNEKFNVKTLDLYPRERPFVRRVLPGSPAERAGLRSRDKFVSIEGVPIYSKEQLVALIGERADQPTAIKLMRAGKLMTVTAVPAFQPQAKKGRIGVELDDELEIVRPGPNPWEQGRDVVGSMVRMFRALVHHKETGVGVSSISGPVGISFFWWYAIVSGGILMGVKIAVLLNLNLAILNLLPIPVLDGGHIVFSIIEAIRRRPLNARFVQVTQTTFAALLISFMLYVTVFSDLRRFLPERKTSPAKTESASPTNTP